MLKIKQYIFNCGLILLLGFTISCEDLENAAKENLKLMYETQLLTYAYSGHYWWGGGMMLEDDMFMEMDGGIFINKTKGGYNE